ncbi:hypothetical protein NDU88_002884 [Pleurodeles waltl]|uniref:Uncharacterized protein n=1 Tax=Pleurodeles waltl TaxID=8319 RepID=A0AAV7WR66_PLEWA|nr:hypothetical protein NDU88_002884 [Pleurodeles waltl]
MAPVSSEELEKLVDGVLPQYTLLYGPPDKQVSQRPPEKIYLACHRQGRPDPGDIPQTEHPLPKKMGRHSPLEQEDCGGSAWDGLPTWEGCPSHHDPPDVQDPGGGVPGVGWALDGNTAATRGSQPSTSATTSQGPVVPVVTGFWSAPGSRAASVARCHSTDNPLPVKHQKLASALLERGKTPAPKAAPRGPGGSVESAATPSKVGKGHKKPGKSGKSSTAEETAIISAAQEATTIIIPAAQEATTIIPAAQEATAIIIPAAQEATAIIPAAQEATTIIIPAAQVATAFIPAAQEATTIIPAAQEATAINMPAAQEATASTSPAGTERTASTSPAGTERTASTCPTGTERTASTSPAGTERTTSTSPAGTERTASTCPAGTERTASS